MVKMIKPVELPVIVVACPDKDVAFTYVKESDAFEKFKELVLLDVNGKKYVDLDEAEREATLLSNFKNGIISEGLVFEIHVLKSQLWISEEIFNFIRDSAINIGEALLNGYYSNMEKQQAETSPD